MPIIKNPFGSDVAYTVNRDLTLNLSSAWVSQHIGRVLVPQLAGVSIGGGQKFSGNMSFYKAAIPQLLAAFAVIEKLGYAGDILTYAGSFYPRMKRGSSSSPSNHSLGTAFDINAEWNGFRKTPAPLGAKGSVQRLLPTFRAMGFTCGADWKRVPDGMHAEINRIMSDGEIAAAVKSLLPNAPIAAPVQPPMLVWNNNAFPLVMDGGRPYVQLGALLTHMGHDIVKTTNEMDLPAPRFYVNSAPKVKP